MSDFASAREVFERSLVELECFAQTLNAPQDAPPFAFVLDCMVDRLRQQWEHFQPLIHGGMGVMTPMETQEVASQLPHSRT